MMLDHFIMRARVVGEDWSSADCICGWHFDGSVKETNAAAAKHIQEKAGPLEKARLDSV